MKTALSILLLVLGTAAVVAQDPPAAVTSDEERLRQVQKRRAALEQELKRLRGEEKSLLGEVEQLEVELRLRTEELRETRLTLRRTQAELDAAVESVRELDARLAAARPALAAHARALYKLGELSYMRLLLSVDRPSDFFRGYRFVTTLARRDRSGSRPFASTWPRSTTKRRSSRDAPPSRSRSESVWRPADAVSTPSGNGRRIC